MKSGFWQVAVKEENRFKTAFIILAGHYEWNVMPFGLKDAPSKFQNVMDWVFKPYFDWLIVYIDDVLIFSKSVEEHFKHVQIFRQVVKRSGLVLSKKKMELFQTKIKFLGYTIEDGQITLQSHALEFADKFPYMIIDKKQLQRFLGYLNYINNFYEGCAHDRKLLNQRLKEDLAPWA